MIDVLVDANFLVALTNKRETDYQTAVAFLEETPKSQYRLIVPTVVLPEVMYLLKRDGGLPAVLLFG
jgi:predicted nucleic acid-binding protein